MATDNATTASQPSQPKRPSRLFGQYIIKSNFQFKFSVVVFLFLSSVALFTYLEGYLAVENMISTGAVSNEQAITQLKLLNGIIGKTSIIGIALTFGLSLFFSHFIAGPIYRFQKVLEEMQNGRLNLHVNLRKHDELKDVADNFNQALSSLRNRLRKERDTIAVTVEKAGPVIEKLRSEGRNAEAEELAQLLEEIKNNPPQVQI